MQPTKLDKLLIEEVSGVDDPANELPGWLVTKERGSTSLLGAIKSAIFATRAPNASDDVLAKSVASFGPSLTALIANGSVTVAKKRRCLLLDMAERLRKLCDYDDTAFTALVSGKVVLFNGIESQLVLPTKKANAARHDTRNENSGRFTPATVSGFSLGGAVHPALRRFAEAESARERGKGAPGNEEKDNAGMYGDGSTGNPNPGDG